MAYIRTMPVVLPADLIGWLVERDLWPEVRPEDLSRFWDHAKAHKVAWAGAGTRSTHPLYLWGDDAQYNERGAKLITIVLGHALDENTNSLFSCFPLIVMRCAPWMHLCTDAIAPAVVYGHAWLANCKDLFLGQKSLSALLKPAPGPQQVYSQMSIVL